MYFHRMHICLAYFYIFVHNPWGGGRTPLSNQPLQRRSVALDILAPLEKVLDLVAQLGLDTQQLKQADQSWWSMILVVNRYFLNLLTVVEIVCLE